MRRGGGRLSRLRWPRALAVQDVFETTFALRTGSAGDGVSVRVAGEACFELTRLLQTGELLEVDEDIIVTVLFAPSAARAVERVMAMKPATKRLRGW